MNANHPAKMILWVLRGYQRYISLWFPMACRFHPTCSEYAIQAITAKGAFKGTWMAVKRIAKCHPFHPGGYDPVS